ncbi:hypothetical protein CDD80_3118 [Ophiocordyceps camponoti-rufipedis]|uniref:RRM domain-containing protein n=1 Tax=Ophiocordyceps camponoti-rufipedis TaxID=2004952 RepID=A0A2C5Z011_9HYPO|nr:hypothetical protein CDD80_3118 [Ophiocordyceps camponoti-rufipedis]
MPPPALRRPEKKPSLGHGLELDAMRKASSCEPFNNDMLNSSDDENYSGGAYCETASDSPLPGSKIRTRAQFRKPFSDDGAPSTRLNNFLVGSSEDDDVFTVGSNDNLTHESSSRGVANDASYQDLRDKVDPQTMYAGSSCMFVANDRRLEEEVTKNFSQFGIVFVKIKRDSRGMPFAFCQYTNDEDAHSALRQGRGIMIFERPCRTEMARAHSSFLVFKVSGQRIRLYEARDLLRRLGEISKTEYLNDALRALAQLPQAVVVTYKMYDAKRDPVKAFELDPVYRVQVYDPKALAAQETLQVGAPREGSFLKKYDKDRRSAYVGNLPPTMTRDVLKSLATSCGEVLDVQLHSRDVPGGAGAKTCFGFIEFSRPDAPDELVEAMHNTQIDGYRVRAERKQSRGIETPRYGPSPARYANGRGRVGSFELEKPAEGHFDTPVENSGRQNRRKLYASSSFTPGRNRAPRPSVLGPDASPFRGIFEPQEGAALNMPAKSPRANRTPLQGPSAKKSVEFDLARRGVSGASDDAGVGIESNTKPTTPKSSGASTASYGRTFRESETMSTAQTTMPQWIQPYGAFGYPYMGTPMTPQANPGLMYAGYMQHPMYHTMCDMYGNFMMSPTHMMPAFNATPPVMNETPVRSDHGGNVADETVVMPKAKDEAEAEKEEPTQ